jgi:glutamate dehydrogenase (NADP+)
MKNEYLNNLYLKFKNTYSNEKEYLQAILEFLESLDSCNIITKEDEEKNLLESLLVPDRIIKFKVPWYDDNNKLHVNIGYRVQYNNSIGPYKGGIRFHESVNESIIKFLGFEQIFKNALTGLPMGGGKGGSDFSPKGKSDHEIMRFCHSFMLELHKYIGQFTDVPAGDIGVSKREIGYMYGMYKKIRDENTGVLTGKAIEYGGSLGRTEATGYGLCYFTNKMLELVKNESFNNKKVIVSGSGNVAIYAALKVLELGGIVIAMSDSNGYVYNPNGIDVNKIKEIKETNRQRIKEYLNYDNNAIYCEDCFKIWHLKCDIALPCATQNEIDLESAKQLHKNGCICIAEGANMPTKIEAYKYIYETDMLYAPGKASNAGGVLVSGLEMSQNSMRLSWSFEEVDSKLKSMMEHLCEEIYKTANELNDKYSFLRASNILGYKKVINAMKSYMLF